MNSAIFITDFIHGQGIDSVVQELLNELAQEEGTGWSLIGHVPTASTCLVRVYAPNSVLEELAENPNYLFLEDVE